MPYLPSERQYRSFAATNFTPATSGSNEGDEPSFMVDGYFTTFSDPYPLFEDYYEEIDPGAFRECDMSDVIFQVNHEGFVYARNRNGSLNITMDAHGGHCRADLSGSKRGREELFEAISNGLVDRMSFGFTIAEDGFEWTEDDDGIIHTRITKIDKLYDVSAIEGFPANPATEISARSLKASIEEARKKMAEKAESQVEVEGTEIEGTLEVRESPAFDEGSLQRLAEMVVELMESRKAKTEDEKKPKDEKPEDEEEESEDEEKKPWEKDDEGKKKRALRQRRMRALSLIEI